MKIIVFSLLLGLSQVLATSKLNLPRVLLPPLVGKFTLEIFGEGCYEWQLSRLDVIQIVPLEVSSHGCSSKALISTISRELVRNTVIVIAEDVSSGQTLRCDVIIDSIDHLRIVTKTRELFMEEAPEVFEVRAYDIQGNEFSSLDNIEFQWNIDTSATRAEQKVLRFMTFKDSPYETPSTVKLLDDIGKKGHMVLLEGLKTGSAKVSVNLPHSEYPNVLPAEVNLTVVANLIIDPPDAYVLKGDTIKFRLLQIRHGRIVEISIPSSQYIFSIENPNIAESIDSRGNMLALQDGRTKVILHYSNDMGIRLPHAYITVTSPEYLSLSLLPHRNWIVEVSAPYIVVVDVYDAANRRFHLGDNVKIETKISTEYFNVKSSSKNGTHHHGHPVKPGVTTVHAMLKAIGSQEYKEPLTTREEMYIFSSVQVTPKKYILPWEENLKYQVKLKASGGDESFTWSSNDQNIATVTQSGVVKTLVSGEVNITAAMTRNIANKDSCNVIITHPTRLQILDRLSLEAEVGQPIFINVALFAEDENQKEISFTNCQQLSFQVLIDDPSFHYEEPLNHKDNVGLACANLAVVGSRIASTQVTVQYRAGNILLEDSVIVGTFNPLITIQPSIGQTVLAVGTSRDLVFSGGPSNTNLKKGTKKVDYDNRVIDVFDVDSGGQDLYIYSVLCLRVGETTLKVVIGSCGTTDCKRSESISHVKVYCSMPKLVSFLFSSRNDDCPLKSETDRVTALNYKDLNVNVIVKDNKGRIFDNATSFYAEWMVSNATIASVRYPGMIWLNTTYEPKYIVPLNHFQTIVPKKKTGVVELTVRLAHYRNVLLKKLNIVPVADGFQEDISASAIIQFVEDTIVTPSQVLLFNHPKNELQVTIVSGSGHYRISQSSNDIARFQWDTKDKHVFHVVPVAAGHMQVTVEDLCLQSDPASVDVEIRQVKSIKVDMVNKIQEGQHILCTVKLHDSSDSALPISQVEFFDLRVTLGEKNIIKVKQHSVDVVKSEIRFQVDGLHMGTTSLMFSTSFGADFISSEPISVMVYPPLKISPKHIIVPVNSKFHIDTSGGPYPDCTFEFTSENDNVKVLSNGLIEGAKVGQTKITGMAVGYLKSNKNKIVFSQDTADVTVVQLGAVKIHTPLLKFMQGTTMPLYAMGQPDDLSPMVLSTLSPRLSFKWSVSSDSVVSISDVFQPLGVQVRDEDRVSVRLTGLKPGKSVVYLKVFSSSGPVFTDSVQIEVFEDLILSNVQNVPLLMSPDSTYQLKINKRAAHLRFSVLENRYDKSDNALTSYDSLDGDIIKVNSKGVIRALNKTGCAILNIELVDSESPRISKKLIVNVKPVQYVMLQVKSLLHVDTDAPILALPQGMNLEFATSFHDNHGRVFDAAKHELKTQTNRNDLTSVGQVSPNHTITAELALSGESVVKIWDEYLSSKPKDYVKIIVDHLITPQKTHLVSGDVVCFSMPKVCNEGSWSSSQPDILAIDANSGIGRARNRPGTALVQYHLPDCGISSKTTIEVLPINSIHFIPTKNKTISNSPNQPYKAELVLFNNYEATTSKTNNLVSVDNARCRNFEHYNIHLYPFTCQAKFVQPSLYLPPVEDIFDVTPSFNLKSGLYSCDFIPKTDIDNTTLTKAEIQLKARSVRGTVVSQPITLTFYPAFFVNLQSIAFENNRPTVFTITAIPEVMEQITLTSNHDQYFSIQKKVKGVVSSGIHSFVVYDIQPHSKSWTEPRSDLFILISSPLTHQNIEIPVDLGVTGNPTSDTCESERLTYWLGGDSTKPSSKFGKPQWNFNNMSFVMTIVTVLAALMLIVMVYQCYEYIQKSQADSTFNDSFNQSQVNLISPPSHYSSRMKPMHASSPIYPSRRAFDETSPVYGSPASPSPRRRLGGMNVSQFSNGNSSQDNSWGDRSS